MHRDQKRLIVIDLGFVFLQTLEGYKVSYILKC